MFVAEEYDVDLSSVFHKVVRALHVINGSLSPWHGTSSGCGWRNSLQYGG